MKTAEICQRDLVVVGCGIGGLAVAERCAREAARQGRRLRATVIERADAVAAGASGSLEGWFHSGLLYALSGDQTSFRTLVNSLEDLYNWYAADPLFGYRFASCNLQNIRDAHLPCYKFAERSEQWFTSEFAYVLPDAIFHPLDGNPAGDSSAWRERMRRMLQTSASIYYESDWYDEQLDCCRAPAFACLQCKGTEKGGDISTPRKSIVIPGLAAKQCRVISSRDAVMQPALIVRDLANSACNSGVEVLTGYELSPEAVYVSRYGVADEISGVLVKNQKTGRAIHFIAQQYVFALGSGFDELAFLRERLDLRLRVVRRASVLVAVAPPLATSSFARIGADPADTFNHVYRSSESGDDRLSYSLLGDSNSLPDHASFELCAGAAATLLEKAALHFGEAASASASVWFTCGKTEFPPQGPADRSYAYWWGPATAEWAGLAWRHARDHSVQRQAEDAIRDVVCHGDPEKKCDRFGFVSESSWALKKALHFALLQICSARRRSDNEAVHRARAIFDAFRAIATQAFRSVPRIDRSRCTDYVSSEASDDPSRLSSNFICVVPGKFSLFPSLAHNVYLELETRGLFQTLPFGEVPPTVPPRVAQPVAERLLREINTRQLPQLLSQTKGACNEKYPGR